MHDCGTIAEPGPDRPPAPGGKARIVRLLLCILLVLLFLFVLGPAIARAPGIRPLAQFIQEREIEAGAYFYTEVAEFSRARVHMRNARVHRPRPRAEGETEDAVAPAENP